MLLRGAVSVLGLSCLVLACLSVVNVSFLISSVEWGRWLPQESKHPFCPSPGRRQPVAPPILGFFCFNLSLFFLAIVPPNIARGQYKLYVSCSWKTQSLWLNNTMLPSAVAYTHQCPPHSFFKQLCPQEGIRLPNNGRGKCGQGFQIIWRKATGWDQNIYWKSGTQCVTLTHVLRYVPRADWSFVHGKGP